MAKCSNKHPSWFKLKTERRQLIKELPPETAVTVLLACLDYLEIGSFPDSMHPIERIAASAFLPDLEEAWTTLGKQRRQTFQEKPYGSTWFHMQPYATM